MSEAEEPQPLSHGICLSCIKSTDAMSFEALGEFSQAELDALPVGVVELDRDGHIRAYNRTEGEFAGLDPKRVMGKSFFNEVAPCTHVSEFYGRFESLVAEPKPKRESLEFLFAFAAGERMASITMNWDPGRERVTLLVELVD